MKFGAVPVADALGATAVHSIRQGDFVLKKGTLIGPAEIAALKAAGLPRKLLWRVLDPGDVSEDQAAADIAVAIKGEGVRVDRAFTGAAICLPKVPASWSSTRSGRRAQPHR